MNRCTGNRNCRLIYGRIVCVTIYLDSASTTPMSTRALQEYLEVAETNFGNPQGNHSVSRKAVYRLDDYRERTALILGCAPSEVYFTSGATEGNNIVAYGSAKVNKRPACSVVEHKAVLAPCLSRQGIRIEVSTNGEIDQDYFRGFLKTNRDELDLISIMTVNNETGVVYPVSVFAGMVAKHAPGAIFHTDAVQAAQIMDLAPLVKECQALTLSAHKFNGPKGTGILYVDKSIKLAPVHKGGSQERDIRPGTQDLPSIGAMVVALEEAARSVVSTTDHLTNIRDHFERALKQRVSESFIQSQTATRSPAITNVLMPGTINEEMLFLLDAEGICASGGAACASGALGASHVITAMGVDERLARSALRFSFSKTSSLEEIDNAVEAVALCHEKLSETNLAISTANP